jgi:uncharacterized phage infection (PIP) family protein YhgE
MSTTSIPSTIAAVEKTIEPLGNKVSGMPIHAANFNAVVEAIRQLLSIVRLQDSGMRTLLESQFALKEHEHPSAVTVNWLDGDLRTRIGDGLVQLRDVVNTVQNGVRTLSDDLARLRKSSTTLQHAVDQFSVNDADRTSSLNTLEGRITTLSESIKSVGALGRDIDLIKRKFDLLQQVLDTLTVDGQTISVVDLRNQVLEHESLLDNLNDVDGTPIRLVTLQQKVRELETISGLGEGLEQRLASIGALIETNLGANFTTRLDNAIAAARSALESSLSAVSAKLDTNVAAVAGLDKRLTDQITASGRTFGELSTKVDANAAAVTGLDRRLTDQITASDRRLGEFSTKLDANVAAVAGLDRRVTDQTTASDRRLGEISAKLDVNVAAVAGLDRRLTDQTSVSDRKVTDLSTRVDTTVTTVARIDKQLNDQSSGLDRKVGDLGTRLDSSINALAGRLADQKTAVDRRLTGLLEGEIPPIVDRRVAATMGDQLAVVKQDLAAFFDRRIAEELARFGEGLQGTISRAVDAGVARALTDQDVRITREVARQIAEAKKTILAEVTVLIRTLR